MDQRTGFQAMPGIFRAYCCCLGLAALVTAPLLVTTGHRPQDGRHALGALAVALLLAASVRGLVWPSSIADENEVQQTLTEAFSLPLMAIAGPAAALVCTQLAGLVGAAEDRRAGRAWHFVITNQIRHVVEVGLAYAAFAALNGPGLRWLWAVFAGAAVSILSSFALAAFGFKLQRQKGDAPLRWGMIGRELALQLAILPTLAVITLTLFDRAALLPLLVASPILALRVAAAADNRRRDAEKRLGVDPLTQLSNHERFWRRLDAELEVPGARVAVVLLDVDDFKGLNDRHGHLTGDACLQAVAGVLTACARPGDEPARYGGEEFALVLPGADAGDAAAVAERLRSAITACHELSFTVSVGVAAAPRHGHTGRELVAAADAALYAAKRAGRNRTEIARDEPVRDAA
jgi:diguanylate cyclase (GGDEF)-like protein